MKDDIEELIRKGLEEPDRKIEEYFKGLYERYGEDPRVIYEYANVLDYLGKEWDAIPLYKRALEKGLVGERKDMCLIQLASSLRVVGELKESYTILEEVYRRTRDPSSLLFLALTLSDMGRKERAICLLAIRLLEGNEGLLPNYKRALKEYFQEMCGSDESEE
ncbi:hypothetical protein HS1genome_1075 [Sulfodiicoccus acidiphilus]|uniref:Tetratrico peptide repeat group 5 domain-containing protein n=1 Tax=Sulfodiicoccus acidiphilus TaxID=1670455 RepID=A0A348B3D4_9CREN|nr:tetratricopeptide repeat protein [Sulfodiicoccus acidiphilus]BBD72686.1 hypothetical protein HS1genome_1075 [Sulfodiicoccus acidiphilus]GGT95503.1 hypothetical protein GCM10007116_11310 [Sulfodiicoccus acidiphilus]